MRSAPREMLRPPSCGSERKIPPRRISAKPAPTRLSTFSRKMIHAIAAVATASRLRSRDAVLACVVNSPTRRSAGPATPPARVAPASQGRSARESGVSIRLVRAPARIARETARPIPEPIEQTSNEQWVGRRDSELRQRCACAKKQRRAKCAQDTAMPIHGECFHVFLQICQSSLPAKYGRESDTKAFSVCVKRSPKRAASSPGRSGYGGGSGSGPKRKIQGDNRPCGGIARSAQRRTATGFSGANTRRRVHKRDQTDRSDCRLRNPLAARNAHPPPRISGVADCFQRKVHRIHLPAGTGEGPDFIACPPARNENFAGLLPERKSRSAEGIPQKSHGVRCRA